MSGMFSGCSSLTSLNLNNFDANNITNKIVDEIPKSCKINENDKYGKNTSTKRLK